VYFFENIFFFSVKKIFLTFFEKTLDKGKGKWYNTRVIRRQQVPVKAMLSCRGKN